MQIARDLVQFRLNIAAIGSVLKCVGESRSDDAREEVVGWLIGRWGFLVVGGVWFGDSHMSGGFVPNTSTYIHMKKNERDWRGRRRWYDASSNNKKRKNISQNQCLFGSLVF